MPNLLRAALLACLLVPGATARASDTHYFGLEVPRRVPMPFEPTPLAAVAGPTRPITGPAFSPDFRRFVFNIADSVYETRRASDDPSAPWSAPAAMLFFLRYTAGAHRLYWVELASILGTP